LTLGKSFPPPALRVGENGSTIGTLVPQRLSAATSTTCWRCSAAIFERNIMTKRIATIVLLVLTLAGAASVLSACNTMEGAGQDIQHGGKALEDSAERNK
jgi:entericidin B